MSHSYFTHLCKLILLDLSQKIIVSIALGYLFGKLNELIQFLLSFLFIFFELDGQVEGVVATHRQQFKLIILQALRLVVRQFIFLQGLRMIKQPKYLVKFTNAYNDNGTVWYTVKVIHAKEGEEWTFKQRYSRMRTIHENCDKGKWKNDLPDFPPRKLFGNTSEEFIQKRKKQLQNYYSTLFRTVDIDDMPEVLGFFNTNKPVKSKPKGNERVNEPEHSPEKTEKKQKNIKRIFDEIVIKYEKEMVQSNEFDNDIEDETRRKFNIEFQKLKLDLKSKILDIVDLPKGDKQNDTDYWNQFFTDSNEDRLKHSEIVSKCVSDHLKESSKCHIKFVIAL